MHVSLTSVEGGDRPRARVVTSSYGASVVFSVGNVMVCVPGVDATAVENARAWAAQLLNAAEQIDETLARAEPAPVTEQQEA